MGLESILQGEVGQRRASHDITHQFSSAQSLSRARLFVTPWTAAARPPCPSPAPRACSDSCPWTELAQTRVHGLGDAIHPYVLSRPLLLPPSIFPSIRAFSNESVLPIRWPKYWSFSISPSSEYSGLISFRMDWLDLLAVQRILKSLLQHHGSKALILWCSAL